VYVPGCTPGVRDVSGLDGDVGALQAENTTQNAAIAALQGNTGSGSADVSGQNNKLTVPISRKYMIYAYATFTTGIDGRQYNTRIRVNGTPVAGAIAPPIASSAVFLSATTTLRAQCG
jgi:hypothetical protein